MKAFLDENFLLETETAQKLYHTYAKKMPICDYHCHLSPQEIWENKQYKDLTELWLGGDHYKWRLMRACGVSEENITGNGDSKTKFASFVKAIEKAVGNPVSHWSHLELQRFFDISLPLTSENIDAIWEKANALLKQDNFRARSLIERSNVKVICTTDDPVDSLEFHEKIADEGKFKVKILPAFRPDKVINIHKETYLPWLKQLSAVNGSAVTTFDALKSALKRRLDHFEAYGCCTSDQALDPVVYVEATDDDANLALAKVIKGEALTEADVKAYQSRLMLFLGQEYNRRQWVMQLHLGVNRSINSKMYAKLGPDTGFDAIGDKVFASDLAALLDALNSHDALTKTILYSLNPRENLVLATAGGSFQGEGFGKIQLGSAWWFNDHKKGMEAQLTDFANSGVLGTFIGMLTDSRSFVSYPRHEYFRRILCNLIGNWVENGELVYDEKALGTIVEDISFNNVMKYMNLI